MSTKPLKFSECSVGLKVKLSHPDAHYQIGPTNPAVGSDFECEGTIKHLNKGNIMVLWSNGTSNSYKSNELQPVCDKNYTGLYISIWE